MFLAFTPAQIGEITGVTPDVQRQWRHQGAYFLSASGGNDGGRDRYIYSVPDAVSFWMALELRMRGFSLRDAGYLALDGRGPVMQSIRRETVQNRYRLNDGRGWWDSTRTDSLTDILATPTPHWSVLDLAAIAACAPESLVSVVRAKD